MPKLEIKKYGDAVLRKKTVKIEKISAEIKNLARDMLETMYAACGVGLAAPQVGMSLRMCVVDVMRQQNNPVIMINPEIISAENKVCAEEGCLSFPGVYEKIGRFEKIKAKYTDLNGDDKTVEAEGLFAKAVQHEIDHLDAKLFIDYLPEKKRKNVESEIKRKKKTGQW
ncbi:MAG: peptide deformylase [Endomicrobium sp.]|jgi:peptide deformylase|nr:peptide deformylase [Endomicrobium sp.]